MALGFTDPLFVFGTLMDAQVLAAVLGRRQAAITLEPALLSGWRRAPVFGRTYPMLVPRPTRKVDGLLLHGLGAGARARLDHYEGEEYELAEVDVSLRDGRVCRALTYLCRPGVRPGSGQWLLGDWQRRHKRAALARIRTMMAGMADAK